MKNLRIYDVCLLCQFTSLKGSTVRGTKAEGQYKHCRYFVGMTHYEIEFHCLLLEEDDNIAQLPPGAYISALHITEKKRHLDTRPTRRDASHTRPSFALSRSSSAADHPCVTPLVQTTDEQLRSDLTDNESLGAADSDPSILREGNSFHRRDPCERCHEAAPRTPQQPSERIAMLVAGGHSDAYPFRSQHPRGWPGSCRSRDMWHPAAASTPPNYLQAESATSREILRRQDSEGDLLRREFFEPSGDWDRMLKEIEQGHARNLWTHSA
jgi:hypothetical protein